MSTSRRPAAARKRVAGERRRFTEAGPPPPEAQSSAPPADVPTAEMPTAPAPRRGPASGRGVALAVVAAVLALAAAGFFTFLIVRDHNRLSDAEAVEAAELQASAAAESAAEAALSYNFRTMAADKERALSFLTPEFGDEFGVFLDEGYTANAAALRAVADSEVLATAVVHSSPRRVQVLVYVDQTTVKDPQRRTALAQNRVVLDMVKRGDEWLVDDITPY